MSDGIVVDQNRVLALANAFSQEFDFIRAEGHAFEAGTDLGSDAFPGQQSYARFRAQRSDAIQGLDDHQQSLGNGQQSLTNVAGNYWASDAR
jgi:hypothetical protein